MKFKNSLLILSFSFACVACGTNNDYVGSYAGWLYLKQEDPERAARLQAKYNYDEVFRAEREALEAQRAQPTQ